MAVIWFSDFSIQWGPVHNKYPTIRLEFNPNKADLRKLLAFFYCLKSHSFNQARVSRIDIAIDYAIYLNPFCWSVSNVKLSHDYKINGIIKTSYFGSSNSDLQIRIYDKAHQLKDTLGLGLDFDFWRVEAQIKAIKGESFFLTDPDIFKSFNPFRNLSFHDPFGFNYEGQGAYSLFILCAQVHGIDYTAKQLNKHTRKKYLSKLKEDMGKLVFNLPDVIYKNCFERTYIRLVNKLYDLFEESQKFKPVSSLPVTV